MLIICVCISEEKIWVIPFNDLKCDIKNINISEKSKYNTYLCNDNNLKNIIDSYNTKYIRVKLDVCLTPKSEFQQREQAYVKKRETRLNFLQFNKLNIQNTQTDFIVNDKKVQEKIARYDTNKKLLAINLAVNNGKNKNNTRKFRTYRLGENDYYWINSNIDDRFWVIPEIILFENKYISESNTTQKCKLIFISNRTKWLKSYEHSYDNIDKQRILNLFN